MSWKEPCVLPPIKPHLLCLSLSLLEPQNLSRKVNLCFVLCCFAVNVQSIKASNCLQRQHTQSTPPPANITLHVSLLWPKRRGGSYLRREEGKGTQKMLLLLLFFFFPPRLNWPEQFHCFFLSLISPSSLSTKPWSFGGGGLLFPEHQTERQTMDSSLFLSSVQSVMDREKTDGRVYSTVPLSFPLLFGRAICREGRERERKLG